MLAKNALNPIEKKLKGIYSTSKERQEKDISTSNLVQMLIQEATDHGNLVSLWLHRFLLHSDKSRPRCIRDGQPGISIIVIQYIINSIFASVNAPKLFLALRVYRSTVLVRQ
jgi:hypothetical protein